MSPGLTVIAHLKVRWRPEGRTFYNVQSFIGWHVCCHFHLTLKSHGDGPVWYWLTNGFCLYGNLGSCLINTSYSCLFSPLSSRAHMHTHTRAHTRAHPHIRSPGACGNMRKTKYCNLMTKVPSFTYSLFPLYSPFSLFISLFLFCSFLDSSSPALPICTAPIFFIRCRDKCYIGPWMF